MDEDRWSHAYREVVRTRGLDPDDAFTMVEAAAATGIGLREVERDAHLKRLRTVKVQHRRVTTGVWLRAWLQARYPKHVVHAGPVPKRANSAL